MNQRERNLQTVLTTIQEIEEFKDIEIASLKVEIPKQVDSLIKHLLYIWLEEKEKRMRLEQRFNASTQPICEGVTLYTN